MRKIKRQISLESDLSKAVTRILKGRGITLDDAVSLFLRSMVNGADSGKCLTLDMTMPFGKYRGADVREVVAVDPAYLRYLIGGEKPYPMATEVLEALQ